MSIKSRVEKLEKKLNINKEDEEFMKLYETLENPTKEQESRMFLIAIARYGLANIITAANEERHSRDEHEKTGE